MQTRFLKIVIVFLLPFYVQAQSLNQKLTQGDSLFRAKQYTQAFVVYQSVLSEKNYTPSMLLKMAYIQEGLGHIGSCLYYLNLYHIASGDEQTLAKMEELAQKHRLEGYQQSQDSALKRWVLLNFPSLALALTAISLVLFAMAIVQKRKQQGFKPLLVVSCIVILFTVFLNNFLKEEELAIVNSPRTYVMDAPSAGGSVLEVLNEGHRVEVLGRKDVWQKVKWHDKDAYIKSTELKGIRL